MIVKTFEQYSPKYWACKLGKISSSVFAKFVTSTGKKSASWKQEAYKLAAEIEIGRREETYQNDAMAYGLKMEDEARHSFMFMSGIVVEEVGLVFPDEDELWCCSPDGLSIDRKHGLEIKCPTPGVHASYIYENQIPTKYKPQVYGSLLICDELEDYNFFSYHPDMKPFRITVDRDNEEYKLYAAALEKYLPPAVKFIQEVTEKL